MPVDGVDRANLQDSMIRCNCFLLRVTLQQLVRSNNAVLELVKHDLRQEDIIGDMMGSLETAAVHVVGEDRLEARPVTVEEIFLSLGVVEHPAFVLVAEQRVWVACKHLTSELEELSTHVHTYSLALIQPTLL